MKGLILLLILSLILMVVPGHAQQGKNGAMTITTPAVVINEYTSLTADATAGSTFIKVSNSALNTHSRFAQTLATGDLVMIIQMQGAAINGTATDSTWGAITSYNNCGLYEFSVVAGVPDGTTIDINCSLKNSYTAAGKVQVVRIPRLSSLTIDTPGVLTCDAWNGTSGGVVAAEVQNNTVINTGGAINATALGFRAGALINESNTLGITAFASTTQQGGEKGEGIAGYTTDYTAYGGMYCRGAPANGGGGGNADNSSGGGGANAGNINAWTGNGNPDTSNTGYITAWNLEYNGFAYSTSSGGGRGGYSVTSTANNPLLYGPGNAAAWTSWDHRSNVGGKGGRPLDYSTGRIFMGGGAGAGHANDGDGGTAGNGGGLVYILSYGTISGSGVIISNGGNGGTSTGQYLVNGDGTGGGGGGGTIILNSAGAITGITLTANGGIGGNQVLPSSPESEGGGGGGGGGYIAVSNGSVTSHASGGANGTTNSTSMTTFPANGATIGGPGLTNQLITNVPFSSVIANAGPNVSICPGSGAQLTASGGSNYFWSPSANLSCDTCSNPVANPTVTTTYVVTVSSGTCFGTDSVIVAVGNSAIAGIITSDKDTVCEGTAAHLTLTGSVGNIQWQSSLSGNNFTNISGVDSITYLVQANQSTYFRVLADSGACADTSASFILTVDSLPVPPVLSTSDSAICPYDSTRINLSGVYSSYLWNNHDTTGYIYTNTAGKYWVTVTGENGCTAVSDSQNIVVFPSTSAPTPSTTDSLICSSDSTQISVPGIYSSYLWNTGDTGSHIYTRNAGPYWVTVTDANGCSAISGHQNISVYPVPSVSIIVTGDTLASFNANGYQWFFNDSIIAGATAPVYIAQKSGSYAVQIIDSNGCTAISNNTSVMVSGITELIGDNSLGIYPNPFTNTIFIRVNNAGAGIQNIELYNITGQRIFNELPLSLNAGFASIDVSALPAGSYYLVVRTNNTNYLQKMIKE